ncbi:MAG: hypothetical protein ACRD4Y_00700, partial [Candidatus Acidiferrales bacterium]
RTPALLIPSLIPISIMSAWVSWRIGEEIEPLCVEPSERRGETMFLPLLYMSVIYSSVVEGFLYEWFLHGGLPPWLRIGIDLLWLSPFFADAAATYVYNRLLGKSHQRSANYVSTRLPSFIVPLLGFWSVFSIVGNEISSPILSFTVFDFGIIVWTVFFTWANRVDLPNILQSSPHALLRRLGLLNEFVSRPLGWVYRWKYFGSYLRDVLILVFCLSIASEFWLSNIASWTILAAILGSTFVVWKGREFWTEYDRRTDTNLNSTLIFPPSRGTLRWRFEDQPHSFDARSSSAGQALQLENR